MIVTLKSRSIRSHPAVQTPARSEEASRITRENENVRTGSETGNRIPEYVICKCLSLWNIMEIDTKCITDRTQGI